MKHYVPVRLTTSRYNLPWFNKDLNKCAKERNDYIRKQKYLEIQKTGKILEHQERHAQTPSFC
jgi:hypothetical protein